jgi:UDP-glucose 4-epimerase
VFNCGYSKGFSVSEVIAAVKRVSGVDFEVRESERRPGDPVALVAATQKIRSTLDWSPRLDDLEVIVGHALDWEKRSMRLKQAS